MLSVRDLEVRFPAARRGQEVRAVRGVSFDIPEAGRFGLVGESGSGKTVTCMALTRLLAGFPAPHIRGQVRFGEKVEDLLCVSDRRLNHIRRHGIAYIFQDPVASLNPYMTVRTQFRELLRLIGARDDDPRRLLELVRLPDPSQVLDSYPAELSGGMCQRVSIALALAGRPRLLIADEPTTDLDVLTRNAILDLLRDMSEQANMALLLVTHDLGIVGHLCDRVAVMEQGVIIEQGDTEHIFSSPRQTYTQNLLSAVPRLGGGSDAD
ncbi:MAG: ABC transporter ATP-binding protein [Spirochaetaceae bacterium]|nr:MAG: ABC transporter ATP-binding protein [Spirochaetaceae bacterium]